MALPPVGHRLTTTVVIEASFVDVELREYFSDLLFKVRTKTQTDAHIYVLFEHKSHPEAMVAFQVLTCGR